MYIIGNGFDLRYGIKTNYCDFYFLNNNDKSFHIPLETVSTGDLWRDFEDTLTRKGLIDAVSEWDQELKKTNLN